jgi:hypothetical protein
VKVLKEIVRFRKPDQDERDEQGSLRYLYLRAMESARRGASRGGRVVKQTTNFAILSSSPFQVGAGDATRQSQPSSFVATRSRLLIWLADHNRKSCGPRQRPRRTHVAQIQSPAPLPGVAALKQAAGTTQPGHDSVFLAIHTIRPAAHAKCGRHHNAGGRSCVPGTPRHRRSATFISGAMDACSDREFSHR